MSGYPEHIHAGARIRVWLCSRELQDRGDAACFVCVCVEGMEVVLRMQKGAWFLPVPSSQSPVGPLEISLTESLLGSLQESQGI